MIVSKKEMNESPELTLKEGVTTRKEDLVHSKSDRVPTTANCSKACNIFQDPTGAVYKGKG